MDPDDRTRLIDSVCAAVGVGLLVGLCAAGFARLLGGHSAVGLGGRGMTMLIGLIGIGSGMGLKAATERAAGVCGEVLFIPITAGAVVAAGSGLAAANWLQLGNGPFLTVAIACVTWGTAAVATVSERLR